MISSIFLVALSKVSFIGAPKKISPYATEAISPISGNSGGPDRNLDNVPSLQDHFAASIQPRRFKALNFSESHISNLEREIVVPNNSIVASLDAHFINSQAGFFTLDVLFIAKDQAQGEVIRATGPRGIRAASHLSTTLDLGGSLIKTI